MQTDGGRLQVRPILTEQRVGVAENLVEPAPGVVQVTCQHCKLFGSRPGPPGEHDRILGGRTHVGEESGDVLAIVGIQNVLQPRRADIELVQECLEIANDGKEALELMESKSFAMLLTDCHMPNIDGFKLTETIRKSEKDSDVHFPIVAITAGVMKEEVDRCIASGMDDCLAKPLEIEKLRETLQKRMPAPSGEVKAKAKAKAKAKTKAKKNLPAEDKAEKPEAKIGGDGGDGPVDPTALKNLLGEDEAMLKETLKDFVGPATFNVDEIGQAFAAQSTSGVEAGAHKLRSSARAVGANHLADLCEALETAGKADNWEDIERFAPQLDGEMKRVTKFIQQL